MCSFVFFLMIRRPPRSTRTDPPCPYTTRFRSLGAFVVGIVRRKLTLDSVRRVMLDTGHIAAAILFLIIAASLYGRMLTLSTIPMQMTAFVTDLHLGMPVFLAFYFALVLMLGMILDSVRKSVV